MTNSILTPDRRALAEEREAQPAVHHQPHGFSDRFALGFTKLLRFSADTFFAKRYGHRAIVLETVAAVPGMVGAMFTHLTCLRRMRDDEGWIRTLIEEAENERMHLMTFIEIAKPMVRADGDPACPGDFSGRLLDPVPGFVAHRPPRRRLFRGRGGNQLLALFEEIDKGRSPNVPAPAIAKHYWKMANDATLRDVILVVRADEAHHRDVNHGFASKLAGQPIDHAHAAPYPQHATEIRLEA